MKSQLMRSQRTHDELYLKENFKDNPKEYYKFISKYISSFIHENMKILDIGCASGDFLYFLQEQYPNCNYTGIEIMKTLIEEGKKRGSGVEFINADIYEGHNLPKNKYDMIFMLGVHSIFDDYKKLLDNIFNLIKEQGRIIIFGIFNKYDLDVIMRVRASDNDGAWESGWNVFSCKSIGNYLEENGKQYRFIPFELSIDIEKHKDDPLRSWSERLENGRRLVISGAQIVHEFYVLEITAP